MQKSIRSSFSSTLLVLGILALAACSDDFSKEIDMEAVGADVGTTAVPTAEETNPTDPVATSTTNTEYIYVAGEKEACTEEPAVEAPERCTLNEDFSQYFTTNTRSWLRLVGKSWRHSDFIARLLAEDEFKKWMRTADDYVEAFGAKTKDVDQAIVAIADGSISAHFILKFASAIDPTALEDQTKMIRHSWDGSRAAFAFSNLQKNTDGTFYLTADYTTTSGTAETLKFFVSADKKWLVAMTDNDGKPYEELLVFAATTLPYVNSACSTIADGFIASSTDMEATTGIPANAYVRIAENKAGLFSAAVSLILNNTDIAATLKLEVNNEHWDDLGTLLSGVTEY